MTLKRKRKEISQMEDISVKEATKTKCIEIPYNEPNVTY